MVGLVNARSWVQSPVNAISDVTKRESSPMPNMNKSSAHLKTLSVNDCDYKPLRVLKITKKIQISQLKN